MAHLTFTIIAKRKEGMLQLLLSQPIEKIGLVTGGVTALKQTIFIPRAVEPGVMTCSQVICSQQNSSPEKKLELDLLVAGNARIRGPSLGIFTQKGIYYTGLKL
jgi:uncharacterized membrane protein